MAYVSSKRCLCSVLTAKMYLYGITCISRAFEIIAPGCLQAPAGMTVQAEPGHQSGGRHTVSQRQQAAEQAGTLPGVQNIQTRGGEEETAVPMSSQGPSYGQLEQEVGFCGWCLWLA